MRNSTVDAARGKWLNILPSLGIDPKFLNGKHHACPKDGSGKDRFRFNQQRETFFCACSQGGDGFDLLQCCNNWDFKQTCKEVDAIVGNVEVSPARPMIDARPALEKAWNETYPARDEVHEYLKLRGLATPLRIRQATRDYYDDGKSLGKFQCMVARIQSPTGEGVSLHITYLKDGVKADVPAPRKIMTPVGTISGAAIRLYPWKPGEPLGIAEGIESAIAAGVLNNMTVWSVSNRNGLETFMPPYGCTEIHIFGDNDSSYAGQAGAYRGAEKLVKAGLSVKVHIPDIGDWNDVLMRNL